MGYVHDINVQNITKIMTIPWGKRVAYFQTGAKGSIKPSSHSPVPYAPVPVGHWDIKSILDINI